LIEDSLLDVHAIFGLIEDDARVGIDNRVGNFLAAVRGNSA